MAPGHALPRRDYGISRLFAGPDDQSEPLRGFCIERVTRQAGPYLAVRCGEYQGIAGVSNLVPCFDFRRGGFGRGTAQLAKKQAGEIPEDEPQGPYPRHGENVGQRFGEGA